MEDGEQRTSTETLIDCMERFSQSEPKNVIVIWDDADGELHWASSGAMRDWTKIGLLETCKLCIGVRNGTNVVEE